MMPGSDAKLRTITVDSESESGSPAPVARYDVTLQSPSEPLGLHVGCGANGVVRIREVVRGGAADRAGVQPGRLLAMNGAVVSDAQTLQDADASGKVAGRVVLEVELSGEEPEAVEFTAPSGDAVRFEVDGGALGEYLNGERVGTATELHWDHVAGTLVDQQGLGGGLPPDVAAGLLPRIAALCESAAIPHNIPVPPPLLLTPPSQADLRRTLNDTGARSNDDAPYPGLTHSVRRAAAHAGDLSDDEARRQVLRAPLDVRNEAVAACGGGVVWKRLKWQDRLRWLLDAQDRMRPAPDSPASSSSLPSPAVDIVRAPVRSASFLAAEAAAAKAAAELRQMEEDRRRDREEAAALRRRVAGLQAAVVGWQEEQAEVLSQIRRFEKDAKQRSESAAALAQERHTAAELRAQADRLRTAEQALAHLRRATGAAADARVSSQRKRCSEPQARAVRRAWERLC